MQTASETLQQTWISLGSIWAEHFKGMLGSLFQKLLRTNTPQLPQEYNRLEL